MTYFDNCCVVQLLGGMVSNILARAQTHIGHTKHTLAWKTISLDVSSSCGCEHCVHCSSKREREKGVGKGTYNTNLDIRPKRGIPQCQNTL